MKGTFCEKQVTAKKTLDPRSFRWKKSGKAQLLIACPRGKWNAKTERCKVGTRAYKILMPSKGFCPAGSKKISKGLGELIPGGRASGQHRRFDPKQLKMGCKIEMEHTNNRRVACEIAKDHLIEDPHYYTKLKKARL